MINEYINRYGRRLYGLCLTLCKNSSDAEELYQDTWLKVTANIDKYNPEKDFEPWLTRICVNIYRNTLRRISKSPIWNGFKNNDDKDTVLNSVPAPAAEDFSDLHAAIDRLPEKLRTTVILFYFRGMDIQSSAIAMNIPPGTVKSRLSKAKKLLKEVLQNETNIFF